MNDRPIPTPALRLATAATVAASGYLHTQLYLDGYRAIPVVGPLFLLQASASYAVAALLLFTAPPLLKAAAAGTALGALIGFAASRTVGVFGFTESGLQPAPQALLGIVTEVGTLLLLTVWQAAAIRRRRRGRPHAGTAGPATPSTSTIGPVHGRPDGARTPPRDPA